MAALSDAEKDRICDVIVAAVPIANSMDWARGLVPALTHDVVVGCLKSLSSMQVLNLRQFEVAQQQLTPEGEQVAREGAPEFIFWSSLPSDGSQMPRAALLAIFGGSEERMKIAVGQAMKEKWVNLHKEGEQKYSRKADKVSISPLLRF